LAQEVFVYVVILHVNVFQRASGGVVMAPLQ